MSTQGDTLLRLIRWSLTERRGGFAESSRDDTRPHLMACDNRQHHALDSEHRHLSISEISHPMQPFLANVKS
jgi:hypothetical protein